MRDPSQAPFFFGGFKVKQEPLRFAVVLHLFVKRQGLTWNEAAKLCGIPSERMEKLASGQHQPLAADAIRLSKGLKFNWEAADFEERGLTL